MRKHNIVRRFCCLLAALILLAGLSVPTMAADNSIDLEREGSISLSLSYAGRPVTGGDLRLYRVGDVEESDGNWYFRLLDCFGGDHLFQKDLDSPDLARRLAGDPDLKQLEYETAVFGTDGKAQFASVRPGLYLLVQTRPADGFELITPFLVSVPFYVSASEGYVYDVDATGKPAVEQVPDPEPTPEPTPGPTPEPAPTDEPGTDPTPTPVPAPTDAPEVTPAPVPVAPATGMLPQTGQLKWPVPVLASLGLILVLLGALLMVSDRRREKR